ncbi:MAG: PEP-CTERM sorting domain-containing protein, partial [Tepidisphaeraceae bacterium]
GLVSVTATDPDNATLEGTGTVSRSTTIGDRGTISPGVGDFNMSNFNINAASTMETFASGGTYRWEVNKLPASGTAGVNWDTVTFNALAITATSGSKFTINVVSLNVAGNAAGSLAGLSGVFGTQYRWSIALNGSMTGFALDSFNIDASAFSADQPGYWKVGFTGNNLDVVLTVPEPSSAVTVGAMAGAALLRRRRRA